MKKSSYLLLFILFPVLMHAQNVGIGNNNPANKLSVNGNLVITQPTTSTAIPPTPAQTYTMINGGTGGPILTDLTGRFYDPGGPAGNYLANLSSRYYMDGFPSGSVAVLVTIESMDLATGDSLIISDGQGKVFMAVGNGYTTTGTYTFTSDNGNSLDFRFKSNADAFTGAGFSIFWKFLIGQAEPAIVGYTNRSLLFDVNNGAFRAGTISPGTFASNSVAIGRQVVASGTSAVALGESSTASGDRAVAFGYSNTASGAYSISMGFNTEASESASTALGNGTIASGNTSIAMGATTRASGSYSTAMGVGNVAKSYGSLAMGRYNDSISSSSNTTWVATDPLLTLGNGSSSASRNNAAVIYKNGNTDISGFTRLGDSSAANNVPRIKTKKISGFNTPGTGSPNTWTFIPHGISNQAKILSISVLVTTGGFQFLPHSTETGYQYTVNTDPGSGGSIAVGVKSLAQSVNVMGMPIKLFITYEE